MEPSKYQKQILEWLLNGNGNGTCNAVAGSGKSSTLRLSAQELLIGGVHPDEVRICVFGKKNSEDLIKKFGPRWRNSISTLHSTGFRLLQDEIGRFTRHEKPQSSKYRTIAEDMGILPNRRARTGGMLIDTKAIDKPNAFLKIVDFLRQTLLEPTPANIEELAAHFTIEGIRDSERVAHAAIPVLEEGERQAQKHVIDFVDQIYLPAKWKLDTRPWFPTFKYVLVDECQDLNAAQLELALMLAGPHGRILAVGDPRQAIMGFSGADNRSYYKVLERTRATELPLSICYRCPSLHIDLVRSIFPEIPIEAAPNAIRGEIYQIEKDDIDKHLIEGDMVLARKTAPLVSMCIKLISRGVSASVLGKDIGEQLKGDLEEIASLPGFRFSKFNEGLETYRKVKLGKYSGLENEEQLTELLLDKLEAISSIYSSRPSAESIEDLTNYIGSLFSDEQAAVTLATGHRSKGLEAERIFIIHPEHLPLVWKDQLNWQFEQELNLLYVMLTRAKKELFIVGEADWFTAFADKHLPKKEGNTSAHSAPTLVSTPVTLQAQRDEPRQNELPPLPSGGIDELLRQAIFGDDDGYPLETVDDPVLDLSGSDSPIGETSPAQSPPAQPSGEPTTGEKRWIDPSTVVMNAATQSRTKTSETDVNNYSDLMARGLWQWDREPLPLYFSDGKNLYPADAHHRTAAAVKAGVPRLLARIRSGNARDALFHSCSCNRFDGVPRSNADKRNQVKLLVLDSEWSRLSDNAVAKHCSVSGPFVAKIRKELAEAGEIELTDERIDARGRSLNTSKIGSRGESEVESDEPSSGNASIKSVLRLCQQHGAKEVALNALRQCNQEELEQVLSELNLLV